MSFGAKMILLCVVAGGVVGFFGYQEWQLAKTGSETPEVVDLAKIEAGSAPTSTWVKLGEHHRLYFQCVYEYETGRGESAQTANSKVNHCYYPVISSTNKFITDLQAFVAEHGGVDNIPDDAAWPEPDSFSVLVKSNDYKKVSELPEDMELSPGLEGVIINRISSLKPDEKKLIQQSFPTVNLEKVLVVQKDRKLKSLGTTYAMMGGGAAIALVPLLLFLAMRKRSA